MGGCVGGVGSKPQASGGKGSGVPAAENFCVFYVKK